MSGNGPKSVSMQPKVANFIKKLPDAINSAAPKVDTGNLFPLNTSKPHIESGPYHLNKQETEEKSGFDYSQEPLSGLVKEWNSQREAEFGSKFDDLSKEEQSAIEKTILECNAGEPVKDPENPGRFKHQLGDYIVTTTVLYYADENGNGVAFEDLPQEDQAAVRSYEQQYREILDSNTLTIEEKEKEIAALEIPECME